MSKVRKDKDREYRISMEIVVDAYGPEEQAMGWYYYLDDTLSFPFLTKCITKRAISPLRIGDEVEVIGMAPEEECEHEVLCCSTLIKKGPHRKKEI
jgi:hypothetical protein